MTVGRVTQIGSGGGAVASGDGTPLYQSYQYWVPVDGSKIEGSGYWGPSRAIFVQNFSPTIGMTVILDNRYTLKVPAGNREVFNIDYAIFEVQYDSTGAVNPGAVTIFSDPQDNQSAIHSLTILGNVNATVSGSVSITGGTVSVTGSSVVVSSIPSIDIGSVQGGVTFNVMDAIVETNTTVLTGILPRTIVAVSVAANTIQTQTIAYAISGFSLSITPFDGFLSLFYTASGQTVYKLRRWPGYQLQSSIAAISGAGTLERVFNAPIPSGGVLSIQSEFSLGTLAGVLKY